MKLPIVQYGNPVLSFRAKEIVEMDQSIVSLLQNMDETMRSAKGVGLAAPQVAVSKRLMTVLNKNKTIRIANPVIKDTSGSIVLTEGCLSIPHVKLPISRPKNIELEYLDEHGNLVTQEFNSLLARIIQHELDHLNGKFIIDHLDADQQKFILSSIGL